MKKFSYCALAVAALAVSPVAFGATTQFCANSTSGGSATKPETGGAGNFMQAPQANFKGKCSRGSFVSGEDGANGAFYAVGAAAAKGVRTFGGHTNGGGVVGIGDCANAGACTASDSDSARGTAKGRAEANNS